jgi:hypothetical protein
MAGKGDSEGEVHLACVSFTQVSSKLWILVVTLCNEMRD